MPSTPFKHIPLARPTEQIRLLKLQRETDSIRLNMQTHELTESPAFVALSYEWGDDSEMHDIIIDGAVLKIRQNLHDALEHIRILQADRSSTRIFEEDSPCFWIDAITIDQSNTVEKTHQVSIMGNIFRQASHVIAWLGLEEGGDNAALAMNHLSTGAEEYYSDHKLFSWTFAISEEGQAFGSWCARSYFERIWIVQECVLARKLHFVCGLQYLSWERFYKLNTLLHYERRRGRLIDELFTAKSDLAGNWHGRSIQDTLCYIMKLAIGRHCSQVHDRIYGLLGILQQSFRSTGMVVDYAVSVEELMIKTHEFLTSDPEDDIPPDCHFWIQQVVEPDTSIDVRGKVAWYWQIIEIVHKLDEDVIKGFHKLESLGGEKERALIFQTICWIVGGYGVDLFSPVKDTTSLKTATTMPTISLESFKNYESTDYNNQTFIMHSRYTTGILTYCVGLTHRPRQPHWSPDDYEKAESKSWGCRSLLATYNKHVQILDRMRESFKVSSKVSDLQEQRHLPVQVEWMVFSNLLAQHFLSKCFVKTWSSRRTRDDGFVRHVEPEGKDLGTFLTESLFSKYHMRVARTSDELATNALKSVEIEITNSYKADHCSDLGKKTLVAALYDNDA